jgi:DNA polymerase
MALREQLLAVADELRRRKADGEKTVAIARIRLRLCAPRVAAQNRGGVEGRRRSDRRASGSSCPAACGEFEPAPNLPPRASAATPEPAPEPSRGDRGAALFGGNAPAAKPAVKLAPSQGGAAIPPAPTFTLPEGDKATRWAWLKERVENDPVCRAHVRPGKKVVLGVGTLDSKIFFCGEAPGADEEVQGEPFVGAAGQLLTKISSHGAGPRPGPTSANIGNWRPEMPTRPASSRSATAADAREMPTACRT